MNVVTACCGGCYDCCGCGDYVGHFKVTVKFCYGGNALAILAVVIVMTVVTVVVIVVTVVMILVTVVVIAMIVVTAVVTTVTELVVMIYCGDRRAGCAWLVVPAYPGARDIW